jgi:hypothetical protein
MVPLKNIFSLAAICSVVILPYFLAAQEGRLNEQGSRIEKESTEESFNGPVLINNQTVDKVPKREFEVSYQQRFGRIQNDADMFGLFSPSNLRLGLDYGIGRRISIGVGATEQKRIYDLNLKYILFRQDRIGRMPVTIAYFGEVARSGLCNDNFINAEGRYDPLYRLSYFHELMVARKWNEQFSLQAAFTYSHFNLIETNKVNANFGVSFLGSCKLSTKAALIADLDYPVAQICLDHSKPNIGVGVEFTGSTNTVQLFVTTANNIVNDELRVENSNDLFKREFLIGFNLSHRWNPGAR